MDIWTNLAEFRHFGNLLRVYLIWQSGHTVGCVWRTNRDINHKKSGWDNPYVECFWFLTGSFGEPLGLIATLDPCWENWENYRSKMREKGQTNKECLNKTYRPTDGEVNREKICVFCPVMPVSENRNVDDKICKKKRGREAWQTDWVPAFLLHNKMRERKLKQHIVLNLMKKNGPHNIWKLLDIAAIVQKVRSLKSI